MPWSRVAASERTANIPTAMHRLLPRAGLTGVGIVHGSARLAMNGDREPWRRLRPRLGTQPQAAPEPPTREEPVAQPLQAEPEQADPPRAGVRRGRGAQPG